MIRATNQDTNPRSLSTVDRLNREDQKSGPNSTISRDSLSDRLKKTVFLIIFLLKNNKRFKGYLKSPLQLQSSCTEISGPITHIAVFSCACRTHQYDDPDLISYLSPRTQSALLKGAKLEPSPKDHSLRGLPGGKAHWREHHIYQQQGLCRRILQM